MILLIIPIITILYMIGGQVHKAVRRFGIPTLAVIVSNWEGKKKDVAIRKALLLSLAIVLSMGYGVESKLMKVFKSDILVRIVYPIMLMIPFYVTNAMGPGHHWFVMLELTALMCVAFIIPGGSAGKIGKYDILIEDIFRGLALGIVIIYMIS